MAMIVKRRADRSKREGSMLGQISRLRKKKGQEGISEGNEEWTKKGVVPQLSGGAVGLVRGRIQGRLANQILGGCSVQESYNGSPRGYLGGAVVLNALEATGYDHVANSILERIYGLDLLEDSVSFFCPEGIHEDKNVNLGRLVCNLLEGAHGDWLPWVGSYQGFKFWALDPQSSLHKGSYAKEVTRQRNSENNSTPDVSDDRQHFVSSFRDLDDERPRNVLAKRERPRELRKGAVYKVMSNGELWDEKERVFPGASRTKITRHDSAMCRGLKGRGLWSRIPSKKKRKKKQEK